MWCPLIALSLSLPTLLFLDVVTTQAAALANNGCWSVHNNTHGFLGTASQAATLDDCLNLCISNPQCVAVDWDPFNPEANTCWLLTSVAATGDSTDTTQYGLDRQCIYRSSSTSHSTLSLSLPSTTATTECWSVLNNTHGFGGTPSEATALDDCLNSCISNSQCVAVDWDPLNPEKNTCWLMTSDLSIAYSEITTHYGLKNRQCYRSTLSTPTVASLSSRTNTTVSSSLTTSHLTTNSSLSPTTISGQIELASGSTQKLTNTSPNLETTSGRGTQKRKPDSSAVAIAVPVVVVGAALIVVTVVVVWWKRRRTAIQKSPLDVSQSTSPTAAMSSPSAPADQSNYQHLQFDKPDHHIYQSPDCIHLDQNGQTYEHLELDKNVHDYQDLQLGQGDHQVQQSSHYQHLDFAQNGELDNNVKDYQVLQLDRKE